MDYPIYIRGELAGTLKTEQEGLYTRMSARCTDPGYLVRLSVFSREQEAVLGVMMPENGELTLTRRLSRRELCSFPAEIEYAAPQGERLSEQGEEAELEEREPEPQICEPEIAPESKPELIWFSRSDGSLETEWEGGHYVAVPLELCGEERERMLEQRTIEGREYAVFSGRSID